MFSRRWIPLVLGAGLLLLAIYRELIPFLYSPLVTTHRFGLYAVGITFTMVFIGIPLLCLGDLGQRVHRKLLSGYSLWRALRLGLDLNALPDGLLFFFWILISPILLLIDDYFPLSVLPLVTPICSIVTASLAFVVFFKLAFWKRAVVISLLICAFVGTEYIDWNPRKPMMRHLYSITTGMTRADVRRMMSGHISNDEVDEGDEIISYITDHGAEYNADYAKITLEQGKVIGVDFSHD